MELKPKQIKALEAILEGDTIRIAAVKAGISERQVYRWLDQDDFRKAVKDGTRNILSRIEARLIALSDTAATTLKAIMDDPEAPLNVKRLAAWNVLEVAPRWREANDLEDRIAEIERIVNNGRY